MRKLNTKIIDFIKKDTCSEAQELRKIIADINGSNSDKLFLGVRDNYINIYYKGMSALKVIFRNDGTIKESLTHEKYYTGVGSKYKKVDVKDLRAVVNQIDVYLSSNVTGTKNSNHIEKEWQQAAVVENNALNNVEWFCVDMEYIMERNSNGHANYGRFDIIAISTNDSPKIALIEVKVDTGAFSSTGADTPNLALKKHIDLSTQGCEKLGSGILGHFSNFIRYLNDTNYQAKKRDDIRGRFNILKNEVYDILDNYNDLGLYPNIVPSLLAKVNCSEIENIPEVVFFLLGDKKKCSEIKKQLDKYVGTLKQGKVPRDTIENTWARRVLTTYNQPNSTINIKYIINLGKPSGKLFNGVDVATANKIY